MFYKKCEKELTEKARFCRYCGTSVDPLIHTGTEENKVENHIKIKKKNKKKSLLFFCITIVAIVMATVVICTQIIIPKQKMNSAMALINTGNYDEAYMILEKLGDHDLIIKNNCFRSIVAKCHLMKYLLTHLELMYIINP